MSFLRALFAGFLGTLLALLFAGFFFILLIVALIPRDSEPSVATGTVLVLDPGMIAEGPPSDPFAQAFGPSATALPRLVDAIDRAAGDSRISALWIQPVGMSASWPQIEELRRAVLRFKESGKPVYASSGSAGFTESAYYLAVAADTVASPPEASFEFDGFAAEVTFFAGMLEQIGVQPEVIRAGDYKAAVEPLVRRDLSEENAQQLRELVQGQDAVFRQAVASGRNLYAADLTALMRSGDVFSARAAHEAGLIDALMYNDELESWLRRYTDQEEADELRTISISEYARVSPRSAGETPGNRRNRVVVVTAEGVIMDGDSGQGGVVGSETFRELMEEAVRDDRTRAIVVRVDSPGGSASASDAMWRAVSRARESVPVVVSMGGVAASGGYYIAAAADTVFADPLTITGSIGVISVLVDASDLLEDRLGITTDTVSTSPFATLFSIARPLSAPERAVMERETASIYARFVDVVAESRNMTTAAVEEIAGGRVYTGQRAFELGLVDVIGGLDDAVRTAAHMAGFEPGDYTVRRLPERRPFIEAISELINTDASMWSGLFGRRSAVPAPARDIERHIKSMQYIASLHGVPQMRLPFDYVIR
ncbi:signal peptide peptidase SppA [soil metagenome]